MSLKIRKVEPCNLLKGEWYFFLFCLFISKFKILSDWKE
jgi:hypothetical protein